MPNPRPSPQAYLGKPISQICNGLFHDPAQNHCAHFVSHVLGIEFPFNCRQFKGGSGDRANIRVHEIFAECPSVGLWPDRPQHAEPLLIFVTARGNVDLPSRTMVNVPRKHIGIFQGGQIFHYSNSQNRVIAESPAEFQRRFDRSYGGPQALFYGTVPGSDLELRVHGDTADVRQGIFFALEKEDRTWYAAPDGRASERFLVGTETSNGNYVGLFMRPSDQYGPVYRAADHVARIDHWAQLLELTGHCEGKNFFNTINTYDSAKFTFGFSQLAAHTPDDNLILLFRELARLPAFPDYFPELELRGGRLTRVGEGGSATDLEQVTPTGPNGRRQLQHFMDYLNALRMEHDMQEVLQAARMIHWTNTSAEARELQVLVSARILQKKMGVYSRWYALDGQTDVICALIADIHHQGRAIRSRVTEALAGADPVEALITINPAYSGRIRDLRGKLTAMRAAGQLGTRRYNAAQNEFV